MPTIERMEWTRMLWRGAWAGGVISLLIVGASSIVRAQDATTSGPILCDAALTQQLEAQYQAYVDAAQQGDLAAYQRVRTAAIVSELQLQLGPQPTPDDVAAVIQNPLPESLTMFHPLGCTVQGSRARLSYRRDNQIRLAPTQPTAGFLLAVFAQEGGAWKLGAVRQATRPKVHEDGTPMTVQDIWPVP